MRWRVLLAAIAALPLAPAAAPDEDALVRELIAQVERTGRILTIAESADERAAEIRRFAPGDPPLLAFRYFEGQSRHRFGELDLVMDDAGH